MRRRKVQFTLIALIMTLISYLVLMVNGLGLGLNVLAGSALTNFDADAIAYSDQAGLSVIRSELGQPAIDGAARTPGVKDSAAIGYLAANYRRSDGKVKSAAFLGFDPGTIGAPKVVSGEPLTPGDADGLLADSSFLKAADLRVGDSVEISLRLEKRTFRILGEIDEGAFFFQPAVYLLRSTWSELKYAGLGDDKPAASVLLLKGKDLAGHRIDGLEIVSKGTAFANIEGVAGQQSTVNSLRFFGYLIGALVIGVFFYVLTLQKVPQIGVLKAVGASNLFVVRQIVAQVLVVAILGLAVSVPLAWLTNWALSKAPDAVPIAFDNGTYLTTCLALLGTALVSTLFSLRQVVKVDPIIALGQQQ